MEIASTVFRAKNYIIASHRYLHQVKFYASKPMTIVSPVFQGTNIYQQVYLIPFTIIVLCRYRAEELVNQQRAMKCHLSAEPITYSTDSSVETATIFAALGMLILFMMIAVFAYFPNSGKCSLHAIITKTDKEFINF